MASIFKIQDLKVMTESNLSLKCYFYLTGIRNLTPNAIKKISVRF